MIIEKSLVLIKPDAVERNIVGKIISIYESNGLTILKMKKIAVSKELAEEHYKEHVGKPFFNDLVSYTTRSDVIAIIFEGTNAISKIRTINGSRDPKTASIGTIRNLFAINGRENSVHASDSKSSAEREIKLWFK
ncbi:nucleoside-diphosphate kinase [Clostridium psychrophilum]|uniref:nucleoside-diphosphate kinase n=1 Tax=Clostridium psychrophilum TaxID=132926 RepID=UPI001C0D8025|nr:nucleoside-diphosphate kinase [Clostridium psychrophilum]MBU3182819.1 nucleoside-diphosphate kinase [Clostridium psychrophilum]